MQTTNKFDHEIYRVIIFARDGTKLLLASSDTGLSFPDVAIPRWQRVAENAAIEMKQQWREEVVCLFELDSLPRRCDRYVVARHWRAIKNSAARLQWIPVADLSENSFAEPGDYHSVQESLARCAAPSVHTDPFVRLSWFEELCDWVGKAIASRGLHLTGNFCRLNASPSFSLIRFETNGPAVWFKAAGKPNQREFPITLSLARLFPKYIPEVIATRPDWNGWLMVEIKGIPLAETTDLSLWKSASTAIAQLQIESITRRRLLVGSGGHYLGTTALVAVVSPFIHVIADLMRRQPKAPPLVLSIAELTLLQERIRDAILELEALGIPDTLGHLDLNPGNIIIAPDAIGFLDWSGAYVGHPFYSFQYLMQHFRRAGSGSPGAEAALTDCYLAARKEIAPPEVLTEALALSPLLAVFAYAAGTGEWRKPERLRDPKLTGYWRALARRMNREAELLGQRRVPCLS